MKKILIVLVISLLSLASCSKNNIIDPQNTNAQPNVYAKNGVLIIKNKEVLNNLIISNSKKSPEELKEWQDSLGFKSYQLFYDDIFSEYESVIDNAILEESEKPILEFMNTYKDKVTFPGGTIDGAPNLTIEPKVSTPYLSIANTEGELILGSKIIDATKIETTKLKNISSFSCSKEHDKRKMHIQLTVDDPNFSYNVAEVTHRKKVLFGWTSYSTRYYWRYYADDPNYFYTNGDVGSPYRIVLQRYSKYLEMWNRGVGEDHKCIFSW